MLCVCSATCAGAVSYTHLIVIVSALGIMMGSGGSAVVGQLLGAGDRKGANRAFSLIAWATFVTGVVCSVLGMAFMDEAVVLLGASAEMAPMAATYGKIVFLCLPMFMLAYVFEMFCSVAGKPGFGFLSSLTAGVVNIGLDAVLMGVFGMGIEGAATATCIADVYKREAWGWHTASGAALARF